MVKRILLLAFILSPLSAFATVTGTASTVSFTCTNSTGPFAFTFPVLDSGSLVVIDIPAGSLPGVMTILLSNQYTSTPVNNSYANGGSVTLVSPCPTADTLVIARATEATQLTHYTQFMPALYANFENNLDQLTTGRQDTFRVDQVRIGNVTGPGVASMTYTPLGQYLNLNFPPAGSGSVPFNWLPVNLLSFATPTTPIDTTGLIDSTAGWQAALNVVCNPTTRYALQVPHGDYLWNNGVSLVCNNGLEPRIMGEGKGNTRIHAGSTLSGLPMLQLTNNFKPVVKGLAFLGNASSPPSIAIESRVTTSLQNWDENSGTIEDVAINIPEPSGAPATKITNGIVWDHDTSGCPGPSSPSCDLNNDQWQIINTDISATGYCFEIVGGNAEWETIIGGHFYCAEAVHNVGGSFYMVTPAGGPVIIANFVQDTNANDFPYLKPSAIYGGRFEGPRNIIRTDPSGVHGQMLIDGLDCSCGPTNLTGVVSASGTAVTYVSGSNFASGAGIKAGEAITINAVGYIVASVTDSTHLVLQSSAGTQTSVNYSTTYAIDWESTSTAGLSASFTLSNSRITLGAGGTLYFAPTTYANVRLIGNTMPGNAVNYGNSMFSAGNSFVSGNPLPTFTCVGSTCDFAEVGDTKGGVIIPTSFQNFSFSGNLGINIAPQSNTQLYVNSSATVPFGIFYNTQNLSGTNHPFCVGNGGCGSGIDTTTTGTAVTSLRFNNGMKLIGFSDAESTIKWQFDASTGALSGNYLLPNTLYSAAGTALPSCVSGLKGAQAVVSDATTPTYNANYSSGGAVVAAVLCNGSNWVTY